MKFNKETIKTILETLTENQEGELYFKEVNNKKWFDITFDGNYGDYLRLVVHLNSGDVEFTTSLEYRSTFDADDIKFFESIDVTYQEIYKHWIKFKVTVSDENELSKVTRKVIEYYL